MKFDHLGVVVADISLGRKHFSKIYGINRWTKEYYDEINGVIVQFGEDETGGFCYELIAPIDKRSPIYNALMNRDRILNHVAYLVDDIDYYYNENLKDDFIILAEPKKAIAYGMSYIQFFLSKKHNYILELIQSSGHKHVFYKNEINEC